jgi:16S rRNA (guanine527-N7)-methyltransferase
MTTFTGPEGIQEAFAVSREAVERLQQYVDLLVRWNRSINLVANADPAHVWHRHIADSLQLTRYIDSGETIIDLGSGGGLPGIPLAITRADKAKVYLVESNHKKAAFLTQAARITGSPAMVIPKRIEQIDLDALPSPPQVVTARALAPLTLLLEYASPILAQGARAVFLKGQDVESELTEAAKSWRIDAVVQTSLVDDSGSVVIVRKASRLVD